MTDRLPMPVSGQALDAPMTERASATPAHLKHAATGARILGDAKIAQNGRTTADATDAKRPEKLGDVQRWMLGAITHCHDASATCGLESILTDGPRASARDRLEVYRAGYQARLTECLLDDYPVLARTLDRVREGAFDALCHAYVERHPSTQPSLNYFGRHMAGFCVETDAIDPALRVFAAELAALEWALVEVLHAAAAEPLDVAPLAALPPEKTGQARFVAADAVRLLRVTHPVNAYYQAARTQDELPRVPTPESANVVVYRRGLTLWRMDLTPAMTRVLGALLEGKPLDEALERIETNEADPDAIAEAARSVMVWFREWVEGGFFTELVLPA